MLNHVTWKIVAEHHHQNTVDSPSVVSDSKRLLHVFAFTISPSHNVLNSLHSRRWRSIGRGVGNARGERSSREILAPWDSPTPPALPNTQTLPLSSIERFLSFLAWPAGASVAGHFVPWASVTKACGVGKRERHTEPVQAERDKALCASYVPQ